MIVPVGRGGRDQAFFHGKRQTAVRALVVNNGAKLDGVRFLVIDDSFAGNSTLVTFRCRNLAEQLARSFLHPLY